MSDSRRNALDDSRRYPLFSGITAEYRNFATLIVSYQGLLRRIESLSIAVINTSLILSHSMRHSIAGTQMFVQ
jgi:hypothetical protein